jgi:hypothetical protein
MHEGVNPFIGYARHNRFHQEKGLIGEISIQDLE